MQTGVAFEKGFSHPKNVGLAEGFAGVGVDQAARQRGAGPDGEGLLFHSPSTRKERNDERRVVLGVDPEGEYPFGGNVLDGERAGSSGVGALNLI